MINQPQKVVVMGGGTGIYPVVAALKNLPVEISCIVAVSDSGGSTGKIRDEFGFQAVGDLRQSLAALADDESQEWIRKLLLYRFEKGNGLKGHNLGNLILTALQDMTDDTSESLEIAQKIFNLKGNVIPVTNEVVDLEIQYDDGTTILGENSLDSSQSHGRIKNVKLTPAAPLNPLAREAIESADVIIIGPGDYYASLMAVLIAEGTQSAFNQSSAKIVYMVNLMTRITQTDGMSAQQHVQGIEQAIGKSIDLIVINSEEIPHDIKQFYENEGEYPVEDDLATTSQQVVRAPLISSDANIKAYHDNTHRSLLRHDSAKILAVLTKLLA